MPNEIENNMPMPVKEPVARPPKGTLPPTVPAWANPEAVAAAPVPPPWANTEVPQEQPVFAVPAPFAQPQVSQAPVSQPAPTAPVSTKPAASIAKKVEAVLAPIEIEDGIPLPSITRKSAKVNPYPFDLLKVGQSFFVPLAVRKMATHANQAMKKHMVQDGTFTKNKKGEDVPAMIKTVVFEIRPAEKDGVQGCRIFRTA